MNRPNLDKIYRDLCDKEKRDLILAKAKFIEKYECFTKLADAYPGWYTELVDTKALTFKNEDVLITDPGYILTDEDENIGIDNSNLEEYREKGLTKSIIHETIYGDWDCEVKDVDTHRIIGKFTADGGMVGVFSLQEVLGYNPKFKDEYIIRYPNTNTIIQNFTGTVKIVVELNDYRFSVHVVGEGNISFKSFQCGF